MVNGDPEAARRAETERAFAAIARIHAALRAAGDTTPLPGIVAALFAGGTVPAGPADPWVPAAKALDWSQVSPLVLGAVRQLDRAAPTRRHLGEHYTSEENVHKTIGPLFLDDLRAELDAAGDDVALHRLWDKLFRLRILDPACGSGNFLVVAYREMRALEAEIHRRLNLQSWPSEPAQPRKPAESAQPREPAEPGMPAEPVQPGEPAEPVQPGEPAGPVPAQHGSRVRLEHFHGIELDPETADLARLALEVAGRQAGGDPTRPRIVTGCALTLDWADLLPPGPHVVVAGNPPFRGHKERTAAQGAQLRQAWGTNRLRHLDYATGWFAKALAYFGESAGHWAFVCTNSVTQGEGVPPLFRPILAAGWRISFAHRTFAWPAGGPAAAGVHVVIVGFAREAPGPRLFDYRHPTAPATEVPAAHINPYLVDGPDVLVSPARRPLCPHLPPIRAGSTGIDWNHLTVGPADVAAVRADPVAARYLRRFVGGRELINDEPRWCLWMAGPDFDPADLARSAVLRERVARVRAHRTAAARAGTRRLAHTPHLFGEIRQPAGAYLALPQTFAAGRDYATAARLDSGVIASVKLFTAPDPDGLLFALFSSALFLTWQKTVGGRLKSDPSLSASVVWNTFPLPALDAGTRAELVAAGAGVLAARRAGVPLARQYAPGGLAVPLAAAHAALDEVVDRAFGAYSRCAGERERQRLLFTRYLDLTRP